MSLFKKWFGGSNRKAAAIAAASQAEIDKQKKLIKQMEQDMLASQTKMVRGKMAARNTMGRGGGGGGGGALLGINPEVQQTGLQATLGTGNRV
jgi:hypothetical protein